MFLAASPLSIHTDSFVKLSTVGSTDEKLRKLDRQLLEAFAISFFSSAILALPASFSIRVCRSSCSFNLFSSKCRTLALDVFEIREVMFLLFCFQSANVYSILLLTLFLPHFLALGCHPRCHNRIVFARRQIPALFVVRYGL